MRACRRSSRATAASRSLDAGVVTVFDAAGTRIVGPSGASALGWGIGTNTVYWTAGPTPFSTVLSGRPTES